MLPPSPQLGQEHVSDLCRSSLTVACTARMFDRDRERLSSSTHCSPWVAGPEPRGVALKGNNGGSRGGTSQHSALRRRGAAVRLPDCSKPRLVRDSGPFTAALRRRHNAERREVRDSSPFTAALRRRIAERRKVPPRLPPLYPFVNQFLRNVLR